MTPEDMAEALVESRERIELLLQMARAMLYFLKDFTFDLQEIQAPAFRQRLDGLIDKCTDETPTHTLQRAFDQDKGSILEFIASERKYYDEREAELQNIIDLLRQAVAAVFGESQQFSNQVYERNIKLDQITRLNDLRRMKDALQTEVTQIKTLVHEKQVKDRKRIESLSREVDLLKMSLEKVQDASMTDPLTGAANRLAFDTYLTSLLQRNEITWQPFALLMCDLDNFKAVNDTYGHQVGDRVLVCFVQECRAHFRKDDVIARYGGEEFAILLPGTDLRDAMRKARRLGQTLDSKRYLIDRERPEAKLHFTVSIGVGEIRRGETGAALIERADRALYGAKRSGKNTVISENEVPNDHAAPTPAGRK